MDFTKAFKTLNNLQSKYFRYDYKFQKGNISVLSNTAEENFQLFIVISTDEIQVCRQLNLYLKDGKYQFNAYWHTEYFSQIYPIIAVDGKLDNFWNDLIERIANLNEKSLQKIDYLQFERSVRNNTNNSKDNIYLSHLRKSKMSQKQFEKIKKLYGKAVAYKVQSMGCTLVFSSNPLKSHTIIIDDLIIK
ncbi:Uncharacterised protein [Streptococcus gallolyticus]|uniref:Uncharacterized protein n=1 Tax=Streptococcus gallolyticus TaxID=315405 RepID=A0AA94SA39_9STRE|nr:hypothetical protein [Streptococcus gallolyticus]AQP42439.1 hypothetical protein BTR42_07315 [Streptococcus gallolyticus subsp. gallolyticus DSM 16831]SQG79740.1 Uncharacterised protein [Streptococcus gallolyticus]